MSHPRQEKATAKRPIGLYDSVEAVGVPPLARLWRRAAGSTGSSSHVPFITKRTSVGDLGPIDTRASAAAPISGITALNHGSHPLRIPYCLIHEIIHSTEKNKIVYGIHLQYLLYGTK